VATEVVLSLVVPASRSVDRAASSGLFISFLTVRMDKADVLLS
jgi:hypothetical protein